MLHNPIATPAPEVYITPLAYGTREPRIAYSLMGVILHTKELSSGHYLSLARRPGGR